MLCSCGRPHATLLAEREDADLKAIDDLRAQERASSGAITEMLRAKINELTVEVAAEAQMRRALKRAKREMLFGFQAAVELTSPEQLLTLRRDQLLELIVRSGLGLAVDDFIDAQGKITEAALETIRVIVAGAEISDIPDVEAVGIAAAQNVFEDVILPDSLAAVRSALQSMTVGVAQSSAITSLEQALKSSTGRQLTVARTQLSSYGRSVTASAAQKYKLDLYLYTGPIDGITRDFCRPLVNKVVDARQMRRLDNGQGLAVLTSGGGYNCRHSWSPITESFLEAAGLDKADAGDIADANKGGKR